MHYLTCQYVALEEKGCYCSEMTIASTPRVIEDPFPYVDTEAALMLRSALDQYVRRNKSSLRKLAKELGYKQSTMFSHMASGRIAIPIDRATELADVLEMPRATFVPAVVKQRYPEVADALASGVGGSGLQMSLAGVSANDTQLTKMQQKILRELSRDTCPEERWLAASEVPLVKFLRTEFPQIFDEQVTGAQRRALKAAIQSALR
jgi:light-regulated signal transduction histidine kinase (bacteriophytochrome)